MNRELEDKIHQLISVYQDLTGCYRKVSEYGHEEVLMIDQGDMESLLELLREKEEIMVEVTKHQAQVDSLQEYLTDYYQLDSFSLKQLFAAVDSSNQKLLVKLQNEIKSLIKQLEILEEQETIHEKMLRSYTNKLQLSNKMKQQRDAAKKAYEKAFDQKVNDIDYKE